MYDIAIFLMSMALRSLSSWLTNPNLLHAFVSHMKLLRHATGYGDKKRNTLVYYRLAL